MRDLTPEECEFIAGGLATKHALSSEYDPVEIVVVHSPPPYSPPPYTPPYQPPTYNPPPPTGGAGGGNGGGSTPPSETYPPDWDHQRDWNIDKVAAHMIDQIKLKPDMDKIEYSGFIYRTPDGKLHESNILQGNPYNTGVQRWSDYGIPADASLVANIHNHPSEMWNGTAWQINTNSVNVDYGDVSAMQNYAHQTTDSQYRAYIYHAINNTITELDYAQNMVPPPAGPATTVDASAVRGGYHPDLGQ